MAGKGGVGKSTIAALLVRALHERSGQVVMAVDADPNSNLGEKLGLIVEHTIGELREELLKNVDSVPAGQSKQEYIEYQMRLAMVEGDGVDLLTMGRQEGPGCYCYINNILRTFLDMAMDGYEHIVIDNEAGMEHLSRRTTRHMDHLLVVSDNTKVGAETAARIMQLASEMRIEVGSSTLILNRVQDDVHPTVKKVVQSSDFGHVVVLPYDKKVEQLATEGKSLKELSERDLLFQRVKALAAEL